MGNRGDGGSRSRSAVREAPSARGARWNARWRVESAVARRAGCAFQWAPHGSIRWDRVMEETGGEMTNGFATWEAFATTANHHFARAGLTRKGADFFAEEVEKRSGSESGWRRARVFALVAGAKPRVELRRGSLVGLSAEEAEEARPAVADAVVRAVDAPPRQSLGFSPSETVSRCTRRRSTCVGNQTESGRRERRDSKTRSNRRAVSSPREGPRRIRSRSRRRRRTPRRIRNRGRREDSADWRWRRTPSSPRSNSSIRGNSSLRRRRGRRAGSRWFARDGDRSTRGE